MNPHALLLLATLPAAGLASELLWDHPGDPRLERFTVHQDSAEVHTIPDPAARSVPTDPAWFSGGHEYTMRACSATACSEPSNAIYVPVPPSGMTLQFSWDNE
jgi:hypothetical protein